MEASDTANQAQGENEGGGSVIDETTPEPEPAKTRLDLLADVVRAQLRIVATLQDLNPTQRLQVIRWINDNHETLIDLDSANNQQRHEHAGDDDE
jgi:flagellar biosynthesis component FlhA